MEEHHHILNAVPKVKTIDFLFRVLNWIALGQLSLVWGEVSSARTCLVFASALEC
jgi:hypothetical protein